MKQSKEVKELSDKLNYSKEPRVVKGDNGDVTKPFYSKEPYVVIGDSGGSIGEIPDGTITTEKFADDAKAPFAGEADIANSVKWANVQEKPATYEPSAHTHPIGQVEKLQGVLDGKVNKEGDTMTGALKFGSHAVSTPTDLSRHIDLYGGSYGISITSYTMNFLTSATTDNTKYAFHHGNDIIGIIQTEITDAKSLTTKEYVDGVVPSSLADVEPIIDPTTATAEDIANKVNEILTALKG